MFVEILLLKTLVKGKKILYSFKPLNRYDYLVKNFISRT